MTNWNYGDVLDAVDKVVPDDRPALIHGDRIITWKDFTRRTNNLAANLLAGGAEPGDKIALYMRNCPEYSEGLTAAFKARLDPRQRQLPLHRGRTDRICSITPMRRCVFIPPSSRRKSLAFAVIRRR
ncbi:MAG: AMP-binding protein [Gammaproteobacteria bacterium]|nr:AMP-binding protein [Gammaproteobacteria bacterium]